ncbi:hypothetical protein M1116_01095 [Patescibacteria group bacterium]|nr:hypothetical protein [Patescibacteria group bacterium]
MSKITLPRNGLHLWLNFSNRALTEGQDVHFLPYNLPQATAPESVTQYLSGWGCSAFAAFHALLALGKQVTLQEISDLAVKYGANPKEGGDDHTIEKVLAVYGCTTSLVYLNHASELSRHLDEHSVALTTMIKFYDGEGFGEHWVTVPQADDTGLLVIDSDYRDNYRTYGSYLLTATGFHKSCMSVTSGLWINSATKVLLPYVYSGCFMIVRDNPKDS